MRVSIIGTTTEICRVLHFCTNALVHETLSFPAVTGHAAEDSVDDIQLPIDNYYVFIRSI